MARQSDLQQWAHASGILDTEPLPAVIEAPSPQPREAFPLDALNVAQRMAVEAVAATFRQDPALAAMISIGGLAGAIGKTWRVSGAVAGTETYANVFVIGAAPRSYGKGSACAILRPITEANSELKKRFLKDELPRLKVQLADTKHALQAIKGSEQGTLDRKTRLQSDADRFERESAEEPSLYFGSTTGAALSKALARNNEELLSFSPEAADAVRVALGKYSGDQKSDFDLMLSAYSCEPFSEARVGRGQIHLAAPCLSVCWLVQPSVLGELLGDEDVLQRGLAARCLFLQIDPGFLEEDDGTQEDLPVAKMEGWNHILNRALEERGAYDGGGIVKCSPEAREVFRQYHNEMVRLRNGDHRDVADDLGRARENAIRLALGQCVADAHQAGTQPSILTREHAERGVKLGRFAVCEFLRLLAPARAARREARLNQLLERLKQQPEDTATLRDLERRHSFDHAEVRQIAAQFPEFLEIFTKPGGESGGRPSECVRRRG